MHTTTFPTILTRLRVASLHPCQSAAPSTRHPSPAIPHPHSFSSLSGPRCGTHTRCLNTPSHHIPATHCMGQPQGHRTISQEGNLRTTPKEARSMLGIITYNYVLCRRAMDMRRIKSRYYKQAKSRNDNHQVIHAGENNKWTKTDRQRNN